MAEARNLYRLNGVTHVAGSINEMPTRCIYSVRRQQNMPLHDRIIPYLERTGLYHLARLNARWFWLDEPLNVAYQLGLPVDGLPVSGCLTDFEKFMEEGRPAWEWFEELFGELPPQNKVKQYTVHFTWFHERFRVLPDDATEETVGHISAFIRPQGGESHPVSPSVGPIRRSRYCLGALCFARRDGSQSVMAYMYLLDILRRCEEWGQMVRELLPDFLPWWYRVALRFLSPDSLIVDPRAEEISQDVVQRGSSQAPPRVPMPNMPNNKRVERRRRVGTRATDQEWRWLDDMIQDDRSGGDRVGHADHRVRGGRPQRRGGSSGGTSAGPGDRPAEHATAET
ncbi:uncharacterized protein DS421_20g703960 [Arachis hypogaea]|nr:uncharacterized protein DS421_20g703960 [Arachis hypogaea]